jgi:hypothetical protein
VSRNAAAIWGVVGVSALLLEALYRLAPLAWEGVVVQFAPLTAGVALAFGGLMAWLEGYRGFQRKWVPLAIERAFSIERSSRLEVALAPLKVLGVWRAEAKVRRRAWMMVVGIWSLVLLVRQLPQPWRGVVDSGVVVGLFWGTVALWVRLLRRLIWA